MGKIPEDEIWLPEPESVVGSILFPELKFLYFENSYLHIEHTCIYSQTLPVVIQPMDV